MTKTEFVIVIVACVIAVLGITVTLLIFKRKVTALRDKLIETVKQYVPFDAVVESVPEPESPVLIFRNREDNATIIHKYKGFGLRKYTAAERIQLLYNEENDSFMITEDNEIYKQMFDTARTAIIVTLCFPITLLITIILIMLL
ncbi:MAG: hypothetical protein LBL98_02670 [Ruminococcus sp.]|jgi:hypothetical protein|nr:hypothetical protein [Ruminococcus sp.]